ncbi:MAG TPA: hypothetical protein VIH35_06425 [Kiritimatiellia bacterium]|jgi:hypothetical protein
MNLEIKGPFDLLLGGASKQHIEGTCYGDDITGLLGSVWPAIGAKGVVHRGISIAVYDKGDKVFAGVEMSRADAERAGLEVKALHFPQHASFKHVGPYNQLPGVFAEMTAEITKRGLVPGFPRLEIYGHWTDDTSKLETTVVFNVATS